MVLSKLSVPEYVPAYEVPDISANSAEFKNNLFMLTYFIYELLLHMQR
jgi:hypothetical protein